MVIRAAAQSGPAAGSGYSDTTAVATAPRLWSMAGLGPSEVDVAQIYDHFSPFVIFALEDYGFCARRRGRPLRGGGRDRVGGRLAACEHLRRPPLGGLPAGDEPADRVRAAGRVAAPPPRLQAPRSRSSTPASVRERSCLRATADGARRWLICRCRNRTSTRNPSGTSCATVSCACNVAANAPGSGIRRARCVRAAGRWRATGRSPAGAGACTRTRSRTRRSTRRCAIACRTPSC